MADKNVRKRIDDAWDLLKEFFVEVAAQKVTQAPPATPQQPLGAGVANVIRAATDAGERAAVGTTHVLGRLVGQVWEGVKTAYNWVRTTIGPNWWHLPVFGAIASYFVAFVITMILMVVGHDTAIEFRPQGELWYTLWEIRDWALCLPAVGFVGVAACLLITFLQPSDTGRLPNPKWATGTAAAGLVAIPMMGAIGCLWIGYVILRLRLAGFDQVWTSSLYLIAMVLGIEATVPWFWYWWTGLYGPVTIVDRTIDTATKRDFPLQEIPKIPLKAIRIFCACMAIYLSGAMYWPDPLMWKDAAYLVLPIVGAALFIFDVVGKKIQITTLQKVAVAFITILSLSALWMWIKWRHGTEINAIGSDVAAQHPLLDQALVWVKSEWTYNLALPHLSYGVLRGLGKGTIYLVLFLAAGFYAIGGYERVSKSGRVGQLIGLVALLILAPCALVCLSEVLGILLGWAHAL